MLTWYAISVLGARPRIRVGHKFVVTALAVQHWRTKVVTMNPKNFGSLGFCGVRATLVVAPQGQPLYLVLIP